MGIRKWGQKDDGLSKPVSNNLLPSQLSCLFCLFYYLPWLKKVGSENKLKNASKIESVDKKWKQLKTENKKSTNPEWFCYEGMKNLKNKETK